MPVSVRASLAFGFQYVDGANERIGQWLGRRRIEDDLEAVLASETHRCDERSVTAEPCDRDGLIQAFAATRADELPARHRRIRSR
jgi:hypothetical protein